jgi:hypothetical protein
MALQVERSPGDICCNPEEDEDRPRNHGRGADEGVFEGRAAIGYDLGYATPRRFGRFLQWVLSPKCRRWGL